MNYSTINNQPVAIKCSSWLQSFKLLRILKKNGFYWKDYRNIGIFTAWSRHLNTYNVIRNRVMINNERFYKEHNFEVIDFH